MSKASASAKQTLPNHGATAIIFENDVENFVRLVFSAVDIVDRLVEDGNSVATSSQTEIDVYEADSDSFDINQSFLPPQFPVPFSSHSFTDSFKAIQKWEGYVIEVYEETFLARLVPIVGEGSDQEAEIYIEEVDPADRVLIAPGSVFYWSIGYLDKPSGRHRDSYIRFRRLPAWTQRELKAAEEKAKILRELLNVK